MRTLVTYALGLVLAANGLFMLAAPGAWYAAVPGVTDTGPLNPHFVRDIGAAYFVAGAGLAWFAARPKARAAALLAALFLGLHALIHFADAVFGRESWAGLMRDLPSVFIPPVLAFWLAWRPNHTGEI